MSQSTNINNLIINKLTKAQYNALDTVDPTQLYMVVDDDLTIDTIYPVGSIYMSVNNVNPSTLFGGTWEQIKDTFLLSAGDTYAAGSTGGEAEHVLTVDEMPKHLHTSHTSLVNANGSGTSTKVPSGTTYGFAYGSAFNTSQTGGDAAHNNMPPYLAVYVWKRTA